MVRFSIFLVLAICCVEVATAQQNAASVSIIPNILTEIKAPLQHDIPFPPSSGFISINGQVFDQVTSGNDHIERIVHFPLGTRKVTLLVEEFDVLSLNSKVVSSGKEGEKEISAPKHILLRGSIEGDPESRVYIAIFENHCLGYIQPSDDGRFLISPLAIPGEGKAASMIVYRESEIDSTLRSKPWNCGTEELPFNQKRLDKIAEEIADLQRKPQQEPQVQQVNLMRIAVECDYSYYQAHGNNLDNSLSYAIAVLGTVCDVYLRDVHVGVTYQYLKVWTTNNDPYSATSPGELLGQLQQYWNDNMIGQSRAATLLFSNKGGGGLAYVGVLCADNVDSYNYAYCGLANNYVFPADGYIWDTDVSSHELGHNIGSPHTHNCSWNPAVDSCVAAEGSCYSTPKPRLGTIMSYCHLTSFGTEMKIHPRVATFMRSKAQKAGCLDWVEPPFVRAGSDKHICTGTSVALGVGTDGGMPPYYYLWWPNTGLLATNTEQITANPTKTTSYVMRVSDGNGMRAYDTVTVFVEKPTVTASPDIITCGVDSVELSAIGTGFGVIKYQWIDTSTKKSIGSKPTITVSGLKSAAYKIVVTDSTGCSSEAFVKVVTKTMPEAIITLAKGQSAFCDGETATLDAGTGFTSYLWSTGSTSRLLAVNQSGEYYCIVTGNGFGCADTSLLFPITVYPKPSIPTISRDKDTLFSSEASHYQWYRNGNEITGEIANTLSVKSNGNYSVRIIDSNGCSSSSENILVTLDQTDVYPIDDIVSGVILYPNPANTTITLSAVISGVELKELLVTDVTGKTMWHSPKMEIEELPIDISEWTSGPYILHFKANGERGALKFVKE
jgi:hypothetical protein